MSSRVQVIDLYTCVERRVRRAGGVVRVRTYYVVLRLAGLSTAKLRVSKDVYEKLRK